MTTAASTAARGNDDVDRNLAFLAYGLLFFSIFFAGAPALIATAIAYSRRADAPPMVRTHHNFQIFVFWVGFGFALLAGVSGLAAVLAVIGEMIHVASMQDFDAWDAVSVKLADIHVSRWVIAFMIASVALGVASALWLVISSAYGFVRLASGQAIGHLRG